ncbi:MAG: caspase family protein [Polaromonas sp.]
MKRTLALTAAGLLAALSFCNAQAQSSTALRATEIRADKLASAPVLSALPAGAALAIMTIEGGWAQVMHESPAGKVTGWVRASSINLTSGASTASGMANGRQASGNAVLTLGVRSLPARVNRHALIIGISRYAQANIPPLPGARIDRVSATQMATAMQVPASNISYLQDDQATGDNIRKALRELGDKVQEGDRVFIHYSGHGTRYNDPAIGGCVESLLAYDGGQSGNITNREMTSLLSTITAKTDKLFVMYDACHSGGLVNIPPAMRTRGLANANDEGLLRPKFAAISEECGRPVNVKTRNLMVELNDKGALPQDVIHISASRDNEISFDDELKGGLATQFVRDCMLRDAVDLDKSGAISMEEIRQCAQTKINQRMQNDANYKPHNLMLSGNVGFVPAWFSQAPMAAAPVAAPVAAPALPAAPPPAVKPPPVVALAPAPAPVAVSTPAPVAPPVVAPLTGAQALSQMFDQRDAKRKVTVSLAKTQLKIAQDTLEMSVQSDKPGYVYVALAGSDNKSVYMLFPNDLDQNNKIEAGQTLQLPRDNWRVKAGGPAGNNNLLVFVADGPRDLTQLGAGKVGPFSSSLNDAQGRAKLGALMGASRLVTSQACESGSKRKNNPLCSDAFGAAMVSVEEVK